MEVQIDCEFSEDCLVSCKDKFGNGVYTLVGDVKTASLGWLSITTKW